MKAFDVQLKEGTRIFTWHACWQEVRSLHLGEEIDPSVSTVHLAVFGEKNKDRKCRIQRNYMVELQ